MPVTRGSNPLPLRPRNSNLSASLANPTGPPMRPGERGLTQPAEAVSEVKTVEELPESVASTDTVPTEQQALKLTADPTVSEGNFVAEVVPEPIEDAVPALASTVPAATKSSPGEPDDLKSEPTGLGGDDMDLLTQPTVTDMDEPADDPATTRKRSASPTAKPPPKRLSLPLTNQQDESPSLPSSSQNEASDVASSTSSSSQNECDSQKL